MSKHTPGPWIIDPMFGDIVTATSIERGKHTGKGVVIAYDEGILDNGTDEQKANARLIASAPDMLEALLLAEKYMSDMYEWSADFGVWPVIDGASPGKFPQLNKVREALAKSSGAFEQIRKGRGKG